MKLFTGIIFWSILLICSACTDENETNNGGCTERYNGTPLTIRATATGFENYPASGRPSTRTSLTDEHLKTEFTNGDSIGIFAVKDGAIVDGIDNIPLVYNAPSGSWETVENGKTLYWYDGVVYVAYYPYKKDITIDTSKDTDRMIASLAENEKLQPAKDQSSAKKHAASDLMVATGTPDTGNSSGIVLNLLFQHRYALLVLQPQAHVGCYAPEDAGFVYHKESRVLGTDSAATEVNLNGITPYQIDSMKYCAIVPPQTNAKIAGSYTTTNGRYDTSTKINYSGSPTSFAPGKCYTLKVISPVPGNGSTVRKLHPGDFVFQNATENRIEIHPGDGLLETNGKIYDYENAIGMVITCDPAKIDAECRAMGWKHAYVMGLDNLGTGFWAENDAQLESGIPPMTQSDKIEDNMNGYSETEQMLTNIADGDNNNNVFIKLREHRTKAEMPEGLNRSPWFIPSIGQWFDMLVNICGESPRGFKDGTSYGLNDLGLGKKTLDKLKEQLAKVDNSLPEFTPTGHRLGFSCSSQYDEERCWMLLWHMNDNAYPDWDRICLQGYNKKAEWNIRAFFAF